MLKQVADGVLVHQSGWAQTNAIVVQGRAGVLLIDPGITEAEMGELADDIRALGQTVVVGFSTHPHWDHLLWDARFGAAPRYGTARCADTIRERRILEADVKARVAKNYPDVPLDLLGLITGLPADAAEIPWDGPRARIMEHQGHVPGHAALWIEERGVLVAADMLSAMFIPLLDFIGPGDPVENYLAGLRLLEGVAGDVKVVIPGHGSVCGADQVQTRIDLDRAYVEALRDGRAVTGDPRIGSKATVDCAGIHAGQVQSLAQRSASSGAAD